MHMPCLYSSLLQVSIIILKTVEVAETLTLVSKDQVARQDSRHRSPEKGRDAECTYSSEIGTVKMDRPCYQNAWWTFAKENPLWRTTLENAPMVVRRSDTRTPSKPPLKTSAYNRVMGTNCTGSNKVARSHKKGCWWIRSKKNQQNRAETCTVESQS